MKIRRTLAIFLFYVLVILTVTLSIEWAKNEYIDEEVKTVVSVVKPAHFDNSQEAIVTQIYSDSNFEDVVTLLHSIKRQNSNAVIIILYYPEKISLKYLDLLGDLGYKLFPVDDYSSSTTLDYKAFRKHYSKLLIWSFTRFHRVVYIENTCLVVGSIEDLINLSFKTPISAAVDSNLKIDTSVMSIMPSKAIFNQLMKLVYSKGMRLTDQEILSFYFQNTLTPMETKYNLNLRLTASRDVAEQKLWKIEYPDARILNFDHLKVTNKEVRHLNEEIKRSAMSELSIK